MNSMRLRLYLEKVIFKLLSKALNLVQKKFMSVAKNMSKRLDTEEASHFDFIKECDNRIESTIHAKFESIKVWNKRKEDLDTKKKALLDIGKLLSEDK